MTQQQQQQRQPLPEQGTRTTSSTDDDSYYYFAYGPVVNDLVRQRRGIAVAEIRAAYLSDYRLTFKIGGLANIVPRMGYEVHGLLMRLQSQDDWDRIIAYDAGSAPSWHTVVPYDCAAGGSGCGTERDPVKARFVEFSGGAEAESNNGVLSDAFLDAPMDTDTSSANSTETLPQGRYLELIAAGMTAYNVDEDYIQDQILAVPSVPKRSPAEYQRAPLDTQLLASHNCNNSSSKSSKSSKSGTKNKNTRPRNILQKAKRRISKTLSWKKKTTATDHTKTNNILPHISFEQYLKLCQSQPPPPGCGSDNSGNSCGDLYFILDDGVFRFHVQQQQQLEQQVPPAVKWLYTNGHGQPDCSLLMHKVVLDVDLTLCDEWNQMTSLHFAWAENHIIEQLIDNNNSSKHNTTATLTKVATVQPHRPPEVIVDDDGNNTNEAANSVGTAATTSSSSSSSSSFSTFLQSVRIILL